MRSLPLVLTLPLASALACTAPTTECLSDPLPPPGPEDALGGGLAAFDSPYLGHTGSWDGKGGAMGGASKGPDLDVEVGMGLAWTFMPVYWSALEPDGPVDPTAALPPAWQSLDAYLDEAHARGLNVLFQAPVVGGNAGAPPAWAGLREDGKSAPEDMAALASFAGKLAARYRPGGALAVDRGWGDGWGVRAWELDNEPGNYKTHWEDQAGDYAEFVTLAAAAIRAEDPEAVILTPAISGGGDSATFAAQALDAPAMVGSPTYVANGIPHSIGPDTDVVSFHVYEALDDKTVDCALADVRAAFDAYTDLPGFAYAPRLAFWHTEGNYDFFHLSPEAVRANWFPQYLTRGFAAGARKLTIMDATPGEQVAVRQYVDLLPSPWPMLPADAEIEVRTGAARAFRHPEADGGATWVLWATPGGESAVVRVPVSAYAVTVAFVDGARSQLPSQGGMVELTLTGDAEVAPPIILVDGGP